MDSISDRVLAEIENLVADLAGRRFYQIVEDGRSGRLSIDELEFAVDSYGGTIVPLPQDVRKHIEVYRSDASDIQYAVDVPIWTAEEGRSDLTLQLSITETTARVQVSIDDLHVL